MTTTVRWSVIRAGGQLWKRTHSPERCKKTQALMGLCEKDRCVSCDTASVHQAKDATEVQFYVDFTQLIVRNLSGAP
jgi:hypothetical protein